MLCVWDKSIVLGDLSLTMEQFPQTTMDDWKALAEKALKGADLATLDAEITPSTKLSPLQMPASTAKPLAFGRDICAFVARIDDSDLSVARAQVATALANGADGLAIVFENGPNSLGRGLPATPDTLTQLLNGIDLTNKTLRIDAHRHIRSSADWLVAAFDKIPSSPRDVALSVGIDHGATFAANGGLGMTIEALEASMPPSMAGLFALGIPARLLEADARPIHNAGGTIAQELGYAISRGVQHLRMLDEARQPLVYGAVTIGFSLSTDQDFFTSIAKLRALRLLWQRILEDCKITPSSTSIHVETSQRMLTLNDDEGNILRNTIAASAAIIGGANSLSIIPHSARHKAQDEAASRIARNTHLVLTQESHIGFPEDAAAGSGTLEAITASLCREAWETFQEIEAEGGPLKSFSGNKLQGRIAESRAERQKSIASGAASIIGITAYQAPQEDSNIALSLEGTEPEKPYGVTCERLPITHDDAAVASGEMTQ